MRAVDLISTGMVMTTSNIIMAENASPQTSGIDIGQCKVICTLLALYFVTAYSFPLFNSCMLFAFTDSCPTTKILKLPHV